VRKDGGGLSSAQAWKGAGESSGMRGRGAGVADGGAHLFIGARGASGRQQWAVIGGVKALMPLMAGVVKEGGGLAWGFKAGRVKAWRWHLKVSSGVAGMAKGGGI
jgi:hypothetical protein